MQPEQKKAEPQSEALRLRQALLAFGVDGNRKPSITRVADALATANINENLTRKSWATTLYRLLSAHTNAGKSEKALRALNIFLRDRMGDDEFVKHFPTGKIRAFDPRIIVSNDERSKVEAKKVCEEYFGYLSEAVSWRRKHVSASVAKRNENAAFKKAWRMLSRDNSKRSFYSLQRFKFARALDTAWNLRQSYVDQMSATEATVMCAVEISFVDIFPKSRARFSTVMAGQVSKAEGEGLSLVEILTKLESEIAKTGVTGAVEKFREIPLYYLLQPDACASIRYFCGIPYDTYSSKNLPVFDESHLELAVHKLLKVELQRNSPSDPFKVHKVHWFSGTRET